LAGKLLVPGQSETDAAIEAALQEAASDSGRLMVQITRDGKTEAVPTEIAGLLVLSEIREMLVKIHDELRRQSVDLSRIRTGKVPMTEEVDPEWQVT
jgi:hypothetical protein